MPDMTGGVCTPAELKRIAEVALKYNVPLKEPAHRAIDLVGMPRDGLTGLLRDLELPAGYAGPDTIPSARPASASTIAASGSATAWGSRSRSSAASAASTAPAA